MTTIARGPQLSRFLARYAGRTLIVHAGFPPDWLEELLKQPGGGGYFRLDSRQAYRRGGAKVMTSLPDS